MAVPTIENSTFLTYKNGGRNQSTKKSGRNSAVDEQILAKEIIQKFLNKLKLLCVRASRRSVEKIKISGQVSCRSCSTGAVSQPCTAAERGHEMQKHINRRWSASAATEVSAPGTIGYNRRDESLLEQQEAIQEAIRYCKRSFSADSGGGSSIISRSVSDLSPSVYSASILLSSGKAIEKVVLAR